MATVRARVTLQMATRLMATGLGVADSQVTPLHEPVKAPLDGIARVE
jgi:hypothetical protein